MREKARVSAFGSEAGGMELGPSSLREERLGSGFWGLWK